MTAIIVTVRGPILYTIIVKIKINGTVPIIPGRRIHLIGQMCFLSDSQSPPETGTAAVEAAGSVCQYKKVA